MFKSIMARLHNIPAQLIFSTHSSIHDRETRNRNNIFSRQALSRGPSNSVQQSYGTTLIVNLKTPIVLSLLRNNRNKIWCQTFLHIHLYLINIHVNRVYLTIRRG